MKKVSIQCHSRFILCLLTLSAVGLLLPSALTKRATKAAGGNEDKTRAAATASIAESYGKLPISFEANQGQADKRVKFLAHGQGYGLSLSSTGAVLELERTGEAGAQAAVKMTLVGANRRARVSGVGELPGKMNYFLGNDPRQWRANVQTYGKVKYEAIYPGVDLTYYGNQQQLEYDFIVAPGADPRAIELDWTGTRGLHVDERGDLILETQAGVVRQHKPFAYQEINGSRREVACHYLLEGTERVRFALDDYDMQRPLVIDPVLSYSTFFGAYNGSGAGEAIAVDAAGNTYITGSAGYYFPTTDGALRQAANHPSASAIFVLKLNPSGSAVLYSALIGGTEGYLVPSSEPTGNPSLYLINEPYGIAVDAGGNAYLTGYTRTSNFPTTPGAFQRLIVPGTSDRTPPQDVFVVKLNALGNALTYATLLGGVGAETGFAVAVNAAGEAWVTGGTSSTNFPTTPGAHKSQIEGTDAFVTKLNAAGSNLLYSTYLGGPPSTPEALGNERGTGIALDANGNVYISGVSVASDFPQTPGVYQANGNVFAVKFTAGGALVYATEIGAFTGSSAYSRIAVDSGGNAYIAGWCERDTFPTTPGAFQPTGGSPDYLNISNPDGFVAKLNPDATALIYATYLGGLSDRDVITGIAVDREGSAYVTGYTYSPHFPTTTGSYKATGGGSFVTKLNPAGSALVYSTLLGLNGDNRAEAIALDAAGNAYITGDARPGFPTTPGAYQTTIDAPPGVGIVTRGFITKVAATSASEPLAALPLPLPTPIPRPTHYGIGGSIRDGGGYGVPDVTISWSGTASGSATSDSRGRYIIESLPAGGSYTITPSLTGRTFLPARVSVNNLNEGTSLSFTLVALPTEKFGISGRITDDKDTGLGSITVRLSGARAATTVTNAQGLYFFTDLPGGSSYTVTPAQQGSVAFVPRSQSFTSLSSSQQANFKRPPLPQPLVNVSAASYDTSRFAANSIITAFGAKLALETYAAASDPLPTYLVGTTVFVKDSTGAEHFAPLFFVSPTQVNYLLPSEVASGLAIATVTGGDGTTSSATLLVEGTAPGLFTADASGRGLVAGVTLRIKADGTQTYEPISSYDTMQNKLVPIPIDLGPAGEQVYLICFGTGFRNRSAMTAVGAQLGGISSQVMFAGAQGGFAGLDQVNLLMPRALAGRGEADFTLSVEGKPANPVKVWIK